MKDPETALIGLSQGLVPGTEPLGLGVQRLGIRYRTLRHCLPPILKDKLFQPCRVGHFDKYFGMGHSALSHFRQSIGTFKTDGPLV